MFRYTMESLPIFSYNFLTSISYLRGRFYEHRNTTSAGWIVFISGLSLSILHEPKLNLMWEERDGSNQRSDVLLLAYPSSIVVTAFVLRRVYNKIRLTVILVDIDSNCFIRYKDKGTKMCCIIKWCNTCSNLIFKWEMEKKGNQTVDLTFIFPFFIKSKYESLRLRV